jgi:hypothetical protein
LSLRAPSSESFAAGLALDILGDDGTAALAQELHDRGILNIHAEPALALPPVGFRRPGPTGFLPFLRLIRELASLEGRQLHHIADGESARQISQSIALRRFAEAFFTTIHEQPQRTSEFTQQK